MKSPTVEEFIQAVGYDPKDWSIYAYNEFRGMKVREKAVKFHIDLAKQYFEVTK